jgi:SAM-dependent methyltransferase
VLFTLSLHHHPEPAAALAEAERAAAPGGRVLVLEPAAEGEIQRFCGVFENEDHRLEAAQLALTRCGMRLVSEETFCTDWVFEGFQEAAGYAFAYYNHPEDPAKRRALRDFLGNKADRRPLVMHDTLRLACLCAEA